MLKWIDKVMRVHDGIKITFRVEHIREANRDAKVLHSCRPELSAPEVAITKWLIACSLPVMVPVCQCLFPGMAHGQSPSEYMLEP